MIQVISKIKGHQYLIKEGDKIKIDYLNQKKGTKIIFSENLLLFDEQKNKVLIGKPILKNVLVEAEVLSEGKGKEIIVFKYKRRKGYRRKKGVRPLYSEILIKKISQKINKNSK